MGNGNKSKKIAVCMAGVGSGEIYSVMSQMCEYSKKYGFKTLVFAPFSDLYSKDIYSVGQRNIFNLISYKKFSAVVIFTASISDIDVVEKIISKSKEAKVPVICIDRGFDGCYNIRYNYGETMEEIVRHFIEHHHFKTFNFIAGVKGNPFSEERLVAFRKVMTEHNLPIDEKRIDYGDFWYEPTIDAMNRFFESGMSMPDAFICANNSMAITVCHTLHEKGYSIPEDVSVSGFDSIEEEKVHMPRLTTAKIDYDNLAKLIIQEIKDITDGKYVDKNTEISHKVVISESCGCRKKSFSDVNSITRKLYKQLDDRDNVYEFMNRMNSELSDVMIEDTAVSLKNYFDAISENKFWLCLVDNYIMHESQLSEFMEDTDTGIKNGYSYIMKSFLHRHDKEFFEEPDFLLGEMLPNLEKELEDSDNILFMPMHFQDRTIGYFAIDFRLPFDRIKFMQTFIMNLSTTMEIIKNHTDMRVVIKRLEDMHTQDIMTGLLNKGGFFKQIENKINDARKNNSDVIITAIDVKCTRIINDTYGYSEGDAAIKAVADCIKAAFVDGEVCSRFSGDEFIVAADVKPEKCEEYIEESNRRLIQTINFHNKYSDKKYTVDALAVNMIVEKDEKMTAEEMVKTIYSRMKKIKNKSKSHC